MSAQIIATSLLIVIAAGIDWGYREFAQIRIGPLFILEILWLALFFLLVLRAWGSKRELMNDSLIEKFKPIWPIFLFPLYCVLRTFLPIVFDLESFRSQLERPYFTKDFLQQQILYVYPLLWIPMAYAWGRLSPKLATWFAYSLFAFNFLHWTLYGFFWGKLSRYIDMINIGIGPLGIILSVYFLHQKQRLAAFAIALLCFLPFWVMWSNHVQATSYLILFIMIIITPYLFNLKRPWKATLGYLAIWLIPVLVMSYQNEFSRFFSDSKTSNRSNLTHSDHPDERPSNKAESHRPSKKEFGSIESMFKRYEDSKLGLDFTRRFMWKRALLDWKESMAFGRGFAIAIPTMVFPDMKNERGARPNCRDCPSVPVTGAHNSYLTILARSGLVGFSLFIFLLFPFMRSTRQAIRNGAVSFKSAVLLFAVLNGLVHAFFNVGFESPHNSVVMWIAFGLFVSVYFPEKKRNNQHD